MGWRPGPGRNRPSSPAGPRAARGSSALRPDLGNAPTPGLTGVRVGLAERPSTRGRGPRAKSMRYRRPDSRRMGQHFGPSVLTGRSTVMPMSCHTILPAGLKIDSIDRPASAPLRFDVGVQAMNMSVPPPGRFPRFQGRAQPFPAPPAAPRPRCAVRRGAAGNRRAVRRHRRACRLPHPRPPAADEPVAGDDPQRHGRPDRRRAVVRAAYLRRPPAHRSGIASLRRRTAELRRTHGRRA